MKTIWVVYTDWPLPQATAECKKKYTFNTDLELEVGDLFRSKDYTTPMQVVKVHDGIPFRYFNYKSGNLMYSCFDSKEQGQIKELHAAIMITKVVV